MSIRLREFLDRTNLVSGDHVGRCCSIQAINYCLNFRRSDDRPPRMSTWLYVYIINMNDAMFDSDRNSSRWKELLIRAAACKDQDVSHKWIMDKWFREEVLPLCRIKDPLFEEFVKEPTHMNAERLYEEWTRSVHEYVFLARRLRDWVLGDDPMSSVTFMMKIGVVIDPFTCLERMICVESTGR